MLSLEEAQQAILSHIGKAPSESVPLAQAAGRFLAEEPASTLDLPPFDNSAMDGYAVQSHDLKGVSETSPITLRLAGTIGAGDHSNQPLKKGDCIRIFTGSPIPPGTDAVVMQEDVQANGSEIRFTEEVKPLENLRLQGEDVRSGQVLMPRGNKLTAPALGLLSACGIAAVEVGTRPRVALLATGNELREPGTSIEPGQIYESNRTLLAGFAAAAGAICEIHPLVRDDPAVTTEAFRKALQENDFLISTGGVSVGDFDFVKEALQQVGGKLEFWKVAIKPGKPVLFGKAGSKVVFGLPGNPVSAMVTFLLLARPAILKFQGARNLFLPQVSGVLAQQVVNHGDRRHMVRVRWSGGKVHLAGPQASHRLGAMGEANGLLDVPPGRVIEAGTAVQVSLWELPE